MRFQRYVVVLFALFSLLAGWVAQAAVVSLLAQLAMPDDRIAGLVATSTVAGLAVGVGTLIGLLRWRRAIVFSDEVVGELVKVTWPTREETSRATTTVVLTTLLVAVLLGGYDLLWKSIADWVLFTEG